MDFYCKNCKSPDYQIEIHPVWHGIIHQLYIIKCTNCDEFTTCKTNAISHEHATADCKQAWCDFNTVVKV